MSKLIKDSSKYKQYSRMDIIGQNGNDGEHYDEIEDKNGMMTAIAFIEIVNYFQKYSIGQLKPREVYKWYCDILPKGKRFNKYIKGKKSKKYEDWLIKLLCNYYKCSKLQVTEYLELIDKEELKTILETYGTDKKQIKKVCK